MMPWSWPWGVIPIREKELKELEEKAEKLEELKAKITQLHECLGEYESHLWCEHCIADTKCAQITMAVNELKDTLETVKTWFESTKKYYKDIDKWVTEHRYTSKKNPDIVTRDIYHDIVIELEKILEAEG